MAANTKHQTMAAAFETSEMIYLDYNATTPLDPEAIEAMKESMNVFGNPSSGHIFGQTAKQGYQKCRDQIGKLINASDSEHEIIILSGGTESINYCLRGAALAARESTSGKGNHIITSKIEHVAVLETVKYLETIGFEATYLPVDEMGKVLPEAVASAIKPSTILCSIMHSNNELGTINPIKEISQVLQEARQGNKEQGNGEGNTISSTILPNILFHSDTSQSLGKVPVDVQDLGLDYATVTGHKIYAPKGIGALYVRKGTPPLQKLIHGAGHEQGRRAGTESTLLASGLGAACQVAFDTLSQTSTHMMKLRDRLQHEILKNIQSKFISPDFGSSGCVVRVNGDVENRLPNTLSISFENILATQLLEKLKHRIAASAGAACHSHEDTRVSYVLSEIGLPLPFARGTLRLSVGKFTKESEVVEAALLISNAVGELAMENVYDELCPKKQKT